MPSTPKNALELGRGSVESTSVIVPLTFVETLARTLVERDPHVETVPAAVSDCIPLRYRTR